MRLKLREVRKSQGKRQWEVAEFLGKVRTTYSQYETGRTSPSLDDAIKIKQYFNYDKDDLFYNSNVKLCGHN